MYYKHTQIGHLMISVMILVTLLYGFIIIQGGLDPSIVATMLFVLFILVSFISLTVTLDENYLRIRFGYGIFRKKFQLNEIASAKNVKNHWYYGWGIRLWYWPYMWIYNVSGFDAVEIIMKNGKIFRIGTDEPKKLASIINRKI